LDRVALQVFKEQPEEPALKDSRVRLALRDLAAPQDRPDLSEVRVHKDLRARVDSSELLDQLALLDLREHRVRWEPPAQPVLLEELVHPGESDSLALPEHPVQLALRAVRAAWADLGPLDLRVLSDREDHQEPLGPLGLPALRDKWDSLVEPDHKDNQDLKAIRVLQVPMALQVLQVPKDHLVLREVQAAQDRQDQLEAPDRLDLSARRVLRGSLEHRETPGRVGSLDLRDSRVELEELDSQDQ